MGFRFIDDQGFFKQFSPLASTRCKDVNLLYVNLDHLNKQMYLQNRVVSIWLTVGYSNWPHREFKNLASNSDDRFWWIFLRYFEASKC